MAEDIESTRGLLQFPMKWCFETLNVTRYVMEIWLPSNGFAPQGTITSWNISMTKFVYSLSLSLRDPCWLKPWKKATILLTMFLKFFPSTKMAVFWLKGYQNLFANSRLIISYCCFRYWLVFNELNIPYTKCRSQHIFSYFSILLLNYKWSSCTLLPAMPSIFRGRYHKIQ